MRGAAAKDHDLGKVPDRVIAERYGITRQAVTRWRRILKIKSKTDACPKAINESIMRSLHSRWTLKRLDEIWYDVLNDYGTITRTTVKRYLDKLVNRRVLVCAEDEDDERATYYTRKMKPRKK